MSAGLPLVVIPDDIARRYDGNPQEMERLRAVAKVVIHTTRPSPSELAERIENADVVLSFRPAFTRFTADVLARARRLRFLSISGTGVEDVDVPYASAHGMAVGNLLGTRHALAEHCLALVFAVARRIAEFDRSIRAGTWQSLPGIEIRGKTLGIVGLSAIGGEFAPLARAVGMNVLSWSRDNSPERAAAVGATATSLDDLLAQSDVVSLHLRLFPELRGFLDRGKIAKMKPGAILINTARGELVDEDALAAALAEGRLLGAGLDVFTMTPLPPTHPFIQLRNVVMTPSTAWNTVDSARRSLRHSIDNVLAFISGDTANASITNAAAIKPRDKEDLA